MNENVRRALSLFPVLGSKNHKGFVLVQRLRNTGTLGHGCLIRCQVDLSLKAGWSTPGSQSLVVSRQQLLYLLLLLLLILIIFLCGLMSSFLSHFNHRKRAWELCEIQTVSIKFCERKIIKETPASCQ